MSLRAAFILALTLTLHTLALYGLSPDDLEDFSQAHWNRRPAVLPVPTETSPFVPEAGPGVTQYRDHLAENSPWGKGPIWHQMGRLPMTLSDGTTQNLGVNVFQPSGTSQGTLLFLHGYKAGAADFGFTLAWFASRDWTVVTLDLPGHGLSEGRQADIEDFGQYGDAVLLWIAWVFRQDWPGPRVLLAHSLGAAAAMEALRRPGALLPDQVIFCAPLLRTNWYPALSIGDLAVGGMVTAFSKIISPGQSGGYAATVHWFHALGVWLSRLEHQEPIELPLTIYSGDKDSVVDADWNQWKFRRLVPLVRWITLPEKDHWFLSSTQDREAFHERLTADLDAEFIR